jgi:hypothetical protein
MMKKNWRERLEGTKYAAEELKLYSGPIENLKFLDRRKS